MNLTIFLADAFVEDYVGGAELTSQAIIQGSPKEKNTAKLRCSDLTKSIIDQYKEADWIILNFASLDNNLKLYLIKNVNYSIIEYDYKFCQYRSLDLHKRETGNDCDCHDTQLGKIISAFLHGSEHIFWMSQKQSEIYHERFPFLKDNNQTVLSSIFSVNDLEYIERLRTARENNGWSKNHWAVIDGNSWIKGVEESTKAVTETFPESTVEVLGDLTYYDLLKSLSEFHGLSFHPLGGDTCPRTVIEASLLGLELLINNNVQHMTEEWFGGDIDDIESYLLERPKVFWDEITRFLERDIMLSGYTTTKNVISSDYPWEASIQSLLGFCDEVVVVDGGSDDGTWEALEKWSEKEVKLRVYQVKRDWDNYRFAVFDGQQKAVARSLCKGDWCWQMDIDEVVHENDYEKVKKLARQIPKSVKLVCLPVIDYWGKEDKVRVDVNPWKWRLSRNRPYITHGIPASLRLFDEEGRLYSKPGSDGCDYVRSDNYEPIPFVNFYTQEAHNARIAALGGDNNAMNLYANWFQSTMSGLPSVIHYSWYDIERKIKTYKNYWSKHWQSLYDIQQEDTIENNMFFDKKWSEVTDEDVSMMAEKLESELGGWIFHEKVDFGRPTPCLEVSDSAHPETIKEWLS